MAKGTKLSAKQTRFVEEYLKDLNATAAAGRAGYKHPNKQGPALLVNLGVAEAIQRAVDQRSARTQITTDRVLAELARIGFADYRKLFHDTGKLKLPNEMDDDSAAVVSAVEVFEEFDGRGDDRVQIGYTKKVRMWDKVAALEKIGKHLGMFTDRLEVSGPGGAPLVTEIVVEHHTSTASDPSPVTD